MSSKVKLAIFDEDLKARTVKRYEVTDGNQIKVKSGGEGHFMPVFDNYSYLEFPKRGFPQFWKIYWDRVYIVRKGAKKCVNFKPKPKITEVKKDKDDKTITKETIDPDIEVPPPDPSLVIDTANAIMIDRLGDQKEENPIMTYLIIILLAFNILLQMGVIR